MVMVESERVVELLGSFWLALNLTSINTISNFLQPLLERRNPFLNPSDDFIPSKMSI